MTAFVRRIADSLTNALTGQGTRVDPRMGNYYCSRILTQIDIANAYEGSGMMAKIIDIPALDMVREWRDWQDDADTIKKLEAEEKRLDLRGKVRLAEIYRGLGGGAMVLGLPGDPASPAPNTVGAKGISYIHVVSRWQLGLGKIIEDHTDPRFGGPAYFEMATTRGKVRLDPSRVICFKGDPLASITTPNWQEQFWGRSRVARVLDAVQNSDSAQGAFASLITKARNVVIGIPGLMDLVANADGEAALQRRLQAMVLGESLYNATLRDAGDGSPGAGETIDHRQVNWAGIPEIMMAFATFLSAVSDIPATRLLGKSPDGMNATGKGDSDNWNKMVRAKQTLDLGPCIDRLDAFLVPSALGGPNADVWYEWAPLDVPSEKERAETFKIVMDAAEKVQMTGAVPERAYAEALQNTLVELGAMPGLEGALAKIPEDERFGISPADDGTDPSALQANETINGRKEVDPNLAGGGGQSGSGQPARRAANDARFTDATPRTLYVQRKLLNAADVIAWAKAQGLETTVPAEAMHVTIAFSRQAIDWMKVYAEDWNQDEDGGLVIAPGGVRLVERLGPMKDTVVLMFGSSRLAWRHEQIRNAGASWDWPEYQPHITISYNAPDGFDVAKVEPYRGELRFGPEIFEEVNEDWKSQFKSD